MIGEVKMWTSANIPTNYMKCEGQSLSTAQYSDLFAVIGYAFGGSGSSFNLPDLRERFVRGVGSTHTLGTFESDANQSHTHAISLFGGAHQHRLRCSGALASNLWTVYTE